jgi:hypothetical protein
VQEPVPIDAREVDREHHAGLALHEHHAPIPADSGLDAEACADVLVEVVRSTLLGGSERPSP